MNNAPSITCIHLIAVTSKNVLVTHKGNAKHVNPLVGVPEYFKEEIFIKATMSDEEIEAFINLPNPTFKSVHKSGKVMIKQYDHRAWYIFTVFWSICAYTGMRMGEVAHLTVNTVDFGRNVFIVEDSKTNTPRFVPIAPNIRNMVQDYINSIHTKYLFPSRRGGGDGCIDGTDWVYNFNKRIKILGIKRTNLTPYSLRHSMCTRLLEEDVSFPKVMKIMGHKDPKTTLQYEHLTTKDIQRAVSSLPVIRRATEPKSILRALGDLIRGFQFDRDNRFLFVLSESGEKILLEVKIKS